MPLRLKLEGIAIAGGARVAVLRNLSGNGLMQLTEGDSHDGWTLDTLSSNSATFSRGAQTSELLLDPVLGLLEPTKVEVERCDRPGCATCVRVAGEHGGRFEVRTVRPAGGLATPDR